MPATQQPILVGHRGYPAAYPENTLAGFRAAVQAGATAIECDIQFSRDGRAMVIHDHTLKRTTGQSGRVVDYSADELAGISAHEPARLNDASKPEPIPSLTSLVELLQEHPPVMVFVEIKEESFAHFSRDYCVAAILADCAPLMQRAVIISFDAPVLTLAREKGAVIGWVIKRYNKKSQQQAMALAPEFLICNYRKLPAAPDQPWAGPWQWFLYDIVDWQLAETLAKRGIAYIETWDIGAMLEAQKY